MKRPTFKEKITKYESFIHQLSLNSNMMLYGNVSKLIQNAMNYSRACGGGEFTEEEIENRIVKAFERLDVIDDPETIRTNSAN